MTSPEGRPRCARDELHLLPDSSTTPSDAWSDGQRCPSEAPARRLSNVIDLQDPARILECSQLERQRKFQNLVRRYVLRRTCQRALITNTDSPAATCHKYFTAARVPTVIPRRVSRATSAVLPDRTGLRRSSRRELWPTTSPARATPTGDCALMSSKFRPALSRLKALSTHTLETEKPVMRPMRGRSNGSGHRMQWHVLSTVDTRPKRIRSQSGRAFTIVSP